MLTDLTVQLGKSLVVSATILNGASLISKTVTALLSQIPEETLQLPILNQYLPSGINNGIVQLVIKLFLFIILTKLLTTTFLLLSTKSNTTLSTLINDHLINKDSPRINTSPPFG